MLVRVLTIAVVVTCASSVASAAVISADHPDFGVGALTRDTDQGLDFLDVTFTDQSTSYNTIHEVRGTAGLPPYPNFAAGGAFEGFRYATAPEVYALIGNSGFSPAILDEAENKGNELSGLFDLLGMAPNASLVFPRRIHGQTGTPDPQVGGKYRAVLMMDVRDPGVLDVVDTRFGAQPSTTASPSGIFN